MSKPYYKWMKFDPKELKKLSDKKIDEMITNNENFITQEEPRKGTLYVQPYRLSVVAIDNERTRRLRRKTDKANSIREWQMNQDSALQLVPPVINPTAEKADTTKEKSMTTENRQSKTRTPPEVIEQIKQLRSGAEPMSLSGVAEKLKISFETVKKFDPLAPKTAPKKLARAASPKSVPAKKAVKKEVKAPKKEVKKPAKAQAKKVEVKKNPTAPKAPKKVAAKKQTPPASSNKSRIAMLTSEIKGKLTLLNELVRKEIESKKA